MQEYNLFEILRLIYSWGFGATIGASVITIIFVLFPNIFPVFVGVELYSAISILLVIGSLFGAGIEGLLNKVIKSIAQISQTGSSRQEFRDIKKAKELCEEEIKLFQKQKELFDQKKSFIDEQDFLNPSQQNDLKIQEFKKFQSKESDNFILPPQQTDEQKQLEGQQDINPEDDDEDK